MRFRHWLEPGAFLILLGSVCFSAKSVFAKLAYAEGLDSLATLTLRMSVALPFYLVLALRSVLSKQALGEKQSTNHLLWIFFFGFIGYYVASLLDFMGLEYISAGLERLVLFVYPTFVLVLSTLFLKKKMKRIHWLALGFTYSGIAFAYLSDAKYGYEGTAIGVGLVVLSAFTYALYLMGTGELVNKVGTAYFTSMTMSFACISVLVHFWIQRPWSELFSYSPAAYGYGFLLGVFSTVFPSLLVSEGIRKIGSSRASIIGSIGPVSTIVFAYFLLGEPITISQTVGTVLVLIGVTLSGKKEKTTNSESQS